MEIPDDYQELQRFTRQVVADCLVSQPQRRMQARQWRQLFYTGSMSARPSKHNKCFSHVDKLSSYLFSPSEVRFTVEFDGDGEKEWQDKAERASQYLNRNFNRRACGEKFAQANETALVEGCSFVKLVWGPKGYEPWVIPQSFMGVLREDIPELDRQEAFTHSFYVTKDSFRRMIMNHPDRKELEIKVQAMATKASSDDLMGDSYFHEIVAGGMQPIGVGASAAMPSYGAVALTAPQTPVLAPEVMNDLIRIDDLWVWDDKREDWTTIRSCEPGLIIEGRYRRRNLSDAPKMQPFVKVCSNQLHNYFWGRSELATVFETQMLLNARTDDIDQIFKLQSKPPRAFSGFQSLTDEKARALLSPGSSITEGAIGAKVDSLAPDMPPNALEYLNMLEQNFNDTAGFTAILSGEGEPGVRAGVHAGVLLRTSTPRLRDRALSIERQCTQFGTLALEMAKAKDARVLKTRGGDTFLLAQLPEDAEASVDSHTSSPAFSEDIRQLAFQLAKAGIIDGETVLEMIHPPREDTLIERFRQNAEAQAKALAANPELAKDSKKK